LDSIERKKYGTIGEPHVWSCHMNELVFITTREIPETVNQHVGR
jgi:hypothetical protein